MRCIKCGSVTSVSHSNQQADAQYRKRFCTNLECRHSFGTWETTVNPGTKVKQPPRRMSKAEKRKRRREYCRRVRAENPEKHKQEKIRWRMRRQARAEAAATNRPVQEIYEAWGVA